MHPNELDTLFEPYMRHGLPGWESRFFDALWQVFPSSLCTCCEGHLFIHCGHKCHKGFEVHGRACNGCVDDRIQTLLRYENKLTVSGRRTMIASEFDLGGFLNYVVLTEHSERLHLYPSHAELVAAVPDADVDIYQNRGDDFADHN